MNRIQSTFTSHRASLALLIGINIAFYVLTQLPLLDMLAYPIDKIVTILHELSHAVACEATGGTVTGLTIVSDGEGHGGLTWCIGGWRWIVTSAGYVGATFLGCILMWLGREEARASVVLKTLAVSIAVLSLYFMGNGLFQNIGMAPVMGSLGIAFAVAGGLYLIGTKAPSRVAHMCLLVFSAQTALYALCSAFDLVKFSMGMNNHGEFSDATNMAQITGLPASVWSIVWALIAIAMVAWTLWFCYAKKSTSSGKAD
jgi:hypothetical protein